jgi:hypothetical protein
MTEIYVPIVNAPYLNANGFLITNNATTPNTKIDISAGLGRDQTNTYDINLGNYLGANPGLSANTSTTLDATVLGAGGIDTGALGASKVYYVYVLLKDTYQSSVIISLNAPATGPIMPYDYLAYRHIGYVMTDASSHFLLGYWSGSRNSRMFTYDAPQATAITAGNATSYTNVNLTGFVPLVQNTPVWVSTAFTPGAASRTLSLSPAGATGDAATVTGQVTSVIVTSKSLVLAKNAVISTVNSPAIEYKVSNSGDAVAIKVAAFEYDI